MYVLKAQNTCFPQQTAMKVLILGASYGALLGTKLLMAGHDVTLVCRSATAALINAEGTVLRITLKGETAPRVIRSSGLPGKLCTGLLSVKYNTKNYIAIAVFPFIIASFFCILHLVFDTLLMHCALRARGIKISHLVC